MRFHKALLTIVVALLGFTNAQAREQSSDQLVAQPSQPEITNTLPSDLWTAGKQTQVAILKEITARKSKASGSDLSGWLDELGTLYAAEFRGPLWSEGSQLSERARDAIAEFRRADEWALDPREYEIHFPSNGFYDEVERAQFEIDFTLNMLKYVDHARRGRFRPTELSLWYERASGKSDHMELLRHVAQTEYPSAILADQHPQHEGFKNLRKVYLQRTFPDRFPAEPSKKADTKPKPIVLDYGEAVRRGQRHPQISLLRQRLKVPAASVDDEDLYDRDVMNAVNSFMRTQGWRRKHVYDNKVRRALNDSNGGKKRSKKRHVSDADIVANMEKWRWLPRNLGKMHVWNNLPSFKTQVVKNGHVIHEERIIIGKTSTQTPVFSDTMTHVVFKPQWGVPSSIKIKSLLPRLASGDLDVLRRRGMRIQYGDDKVVSPAKFNWSRTDIQSIPIVMGAGSSNPLGNVKFMFPNHHSVYMHDTPDRHLFNSSERLFSHGCIRVRDPIRFAEVILGETSNWSKNQVMTHLDRRAKENNRIDLDSSVSVHNTYFTVMADENGGLETLPDIYDHDTRIKQALDGKSLARIAANDPARIQQREMERLAKAPRYIANKRSRIDAEYAYAEPFALGGPSFFAAPKPKKWNKKKKKPHNWSMHPYQQYFSGN